MSTVIRASAYPSSPLSSLTPLSERSTPEQGMPAAVYAERTSAAPSPAAESAAHNQAELRALKVQLCGIFSRIGAKRQANEHPPTPDELAHFRLEIGRETRNSVLAKVIYSSAGAEGRKNREWHMLAASAEAKNALETAKACVTRFRALEQALASTPEPQSVAALAASGAGTSSVTRRASKRRLSDSSLPGSGRRTPAASSSSNPRPPTQAGPRRQAQAELIDRLYPPHAEMNAAPSAVELALRRYDVTEALRLLGITPIAGTLHDVAFPTAVQVCHAAISAGNPDALCAMLVVQPRGFVDRMQAARNVHTGRSIRDEVMELAARVGRPALRKYLKQFPYPYYSKQGDISIRLNGEASYVQEGYAGDPITCRDLATAWVLERMQAPTGKVDYANFSTVEALETLDPVRIHAQRRLMFAAASKRYLVHLHDFGKVLEQLFASMEKASADAGPAAKRKILFFVNTDTHVLAGACTSHGDPPVYRTVVYDPNTTATDKSLVASSLATVRGWQLPDLYLHGQVQNYHPFEEKIIGMHVLPETLPESARAHGQALPATTHHNWLVDTSSEDWINRVTPLQVEAMLANGLHEDWREIIDSLPASLPQDRLRGLLAASSKAIYNKVQVLDFSDTLRTYIRTVGGLSMIDDTAKFQLISNASQSADRDDYPTPAFLAAYLDEVMGLPLQEEMRVRLVIPELHQHGSETQMPYLHVLAQRLQSDLVNVFLDRVESMPISDANKLRIIAGADGNGRTAITHPMDENMPELVERFIVAIMRLNVPDEKKAAVIFNSVPDGVTKEQVLDGADLPADGRAISRLLHDAMSKLRIPDAYKDTLFLPRPVPSDPGSDGSYLTD